MGAVFTLLVCASVAVAAARGRMADVTAAALESAGKAVTLSLGLAGAMAELKRRPDEAVFLESWISNSDKVFAVFRPPLD